VNFIKALGSLVVAIVLVVFVLGVIAFSSIISWIFLIGVVVWIISRIIYNSVKKRNPHIKK